MIRTLAFALLVGTAIPAMAQTVAITGGTVALGDGSEPQPGTVVVRNGRVVAAGPGVSVPSGAEVVDASGKWVTPGMVAGFTRLGITELDIGAASTTDQSSTGPYSAAIDVAQAFNPMMPTVANNRAEGITRALVAPSTSNSIFGGQGALVDLGADMDAVQRPRLFQFVELGETGAGAAGGSRPSAHALFRNALREAMELSRYSDRRSEATGRSEARQPISPDEPIETQLLDPSARRSEDVRLTRFDAAALVPVVQGRQALLVRVNQASDILAVLGLKREFPRLRLVLVDADEGWMVADRIAAADVPVLASALSNLPSSFESRGATHSNIGRMRAAGVRVAISSEGDSRYLFRARQYAGNLVALGRVAGHTGLSWGDAFAMVTSRPAEAFGLGGEIGSLAPGRRGDVVIWSGDPLELSSAPEAVWIDGVRQPLENRQQKLRDRYRDLTRRELPEAYRR